MTPRPHGTEDTKANATLAAVPGVTDLPPEPEHLAPPSNCMFQQPLGETDVFVDDFIQLGQGGPQQMKALRCHLLAAIDAVLARPGLKESHRREAASLKKLLQGDGSWATRKLILGWIIDTLRQTIELLPHRKETLAQIFGRTVQRPATRTEPLPWESHPHHRNPMTPHRCLRQPGCQPVSPSHSPGRDRAPRT